MNFFFFLGLLFLLATLVILFAGIGTMAKGGETNKKYGNKLMRARVICQGLAVACFLLWAVT
ncbi:MAG: twin transmembrane helix small protein [Alphaproteobacteria bacterium]|nr:twin transmembrane helix small protein [Alphaproteobacteria bacterium]